MRAPACNRLGLISFNDQHPVGAMQMGDEEGAAESRRAALHGRLSFQQQRGRGGRGGARGGAAGGRSSKRTSTTAASTTRAGGRRK